MNATLIIGNKNYSTWSLRTWLLLREAGIEFEEHRIALDVADTRAQIAEFTDAGRVPVLILDGCTVWDTLAIAETVAERWPDKQSGRALNSSASKSAWAEQSSHPDTWSFTRTLSPSERRPAIQSGSRSASS